MNISGDSIGTKVTIGDLKRGDFATLSANYGGGVRIARTEAHGRDSLVWITWEASGRLRRAAFPRTNPTVRL